MNQYSYMEFASAGSLSKWHMRKLSEKGRKLAGGIDTPSLCGKNYTGWDLKADVPPPNTQKPTYVCEACWNQYQTGN